MKPVPPPDPDLAALVPPPGPRAVEARIRRRPDALPERAAGAPDATGAALRRPRLLWRAARAGARLYRRETHLRLAVPGLAPAAALRLAIEKLVEAEALLDERRRAHAPDYAPRRHVLILSALLAERAAQET